MSNPPERPQPKYIYQNMIMDTKRWEGHESRSGDILICTSYKAGTTWMQMICALLIFQKPELHAPLSDFSPWLERSSADVAEVHAHLASQRHRRFIKTHTPLDALPWFEDGVYLFVGRDPRDVFFSMLDHTANVHPEYFEKMIAMSGISADGELPELPEDPNTRFRMWLTQGTVEWEQDGFPYWSHLRHALSFWEYRDLPNIHFFHYDQLLADLDGEMRRVAGILQIPVDETIWPELVEAATFDAMKSRADQLAPDAAESVWADNKKFFRRGVSGRWRDTLDDKSQSLYERVLAERLPPDLARFLESGEGRP